MDFVQTPQRVYILGQPPPPTPHLWTKFKLNLFTLILAIVKACMYYDSSCYLYILEGLAPYGGQTSSSCGGLVAFGHQMGALWAPWLLKLKFGALHATPSISCEGLVAFGHQMWALWAPIQ